MFRELPPEFGFSLVENHTAVIGAADLGEPVREFSLPALHVARHLLSNGEFDQYRDEMRGLPWAQFANTRDGRISLIARGADQKTFGDRIREPEVDSVLEVHRVVPESRELPGELAGANKPAALITYYELLSYYDALAGRLRAEGHSVEEGRIMTDEEDEAIRRGKGVDLRHLVEVEGWSLKDFADMVANRYDVIQVMTNAARRIFTEPTDQNLLAVLGTDATIVGFRKYATPSGRFSEDEIWINRGKVGTADVNWGPAGDWGIKQGGGNLWAFTASRFQRPYHRDSRNSWDHAMVVRGGSWYGLNPHDARLAHRGSDYLPGVSVLGGRGVLVPQRLG